MIFLIIGLSSLFVAIGFIVTEKNAKYLLSGYNTLPEVEQQKIDIKTYLVFFKRFQIFLGLSFFVGSTLLYYLANQNVAGIFLSVYPILAYIYFVWKSNSFYKKINKKTSRIGIYILIGTLVFISILLGMGFKTDKLLVLPESIKIEGTYGEEILASDIDSLYLVDNIPEISYKSNGFALGAIKKGYFKTKSGEEIKLILNSGSKPFLLISKKSGKKIYYSDKDGNTSDAYKKIVSQFSSLKNVP